MKSVEVSTIMGEYLNIAREWREIFKREKSWDRLVAMSIGMILNSERKTITNNLIYMGEADKDWSAAYKIFSRSEWDADKLYNPLIGFWYEDTKMRGGKGAPMVAAIDSTVIKKNRETYTRNTVLEGPDVAWVSSESDVGDEGIEDIGDGAEQREDARLGAWSSRKI